MKRKRDDEKGGDGVQWYRGEIIGKGSFGSVYLAKLKKPKSKFGCFPETMAVKSAEVSLSGSIQKEREALQNIGMCRNIIKCFGDEVTTGENGKMVYNLLLEYGSGGTLADLIKKTNGSGLNERDVRNYSRSILRGISHIHENGYVHCDIKPENLLLVSGFDSKFRVKIGDFGLAKRGMKSNSKRKLDLYWRGTPTYLSPEAVMESVQEAPSDIWAFGCVVLEMLTGKPAWGNLDDVDSEAFSERIGKNYEVPKIPDGVSTEAREFLRGCFSRNPKFRLTAEMLLNHSFLEGLYEDVDVDEDEDEEVEDIDIVEEGDIYTDELGVSFVVYDTNEGDYGEYNVALEFDDDDELYGFDTDGVWSDEETVVMTSKGSAFDGVAKVDKEVLTNVSPQNSIIPITVQAGV